MEVQAAPMFEHRYGPNHTIWNGDRMAKSKLTPEERKREYMRQWSAENAERRKEYNREWAKAHPKRPRKPLTPEQKERKRESNRRSAAKNLIKDNEAKRKWRLANPEYNRKYRLEHPEKWLKPLTPEQRERKREVDRKYHQEYERKPPTPEQREKERQRGREYAKKNAEKAKAKARAWYDANPDRARESRRAYAQGPKREELLEKKREYNAAHSKERVARSKAWAEANRERYRENARIASHRRRARKLASPGTHTRSDIKRLLEFQREQCATCRVQLIKTGKGKFHIDHIQPLARGGSNGAENLQLLCPTCNFRKRDKTPEEWAKENGRLFI
jgi:hypothetical protein